MSKSATAVAVRQDAPTGVRATHASPEIADCEIAAEINETLKQLAPIEESVIRVVVSHRIVSLYGWVRCWTEWHTVERAAWCAPGVCLVRNHLAIAYGGEA